MIDPQGLFHLLYFLLSIFITYILGKQFLPPPRTGQYWSIFRISTLSLATGFFLATIILRFTGQIKGDYLLVALIFILVFAIDNLSWPTK